MLSLRDVAQRCLDVTGRISVNNDVFGYIFRDTDGSLFGSLQAGDTLPGTNSATGRSLRRLLQTINGSAFDLVPIFVGHENDFSGTFSRDDATKVQYAIQIARDIYAQQNLGIRRINWQRIPEADVGDYANIDRPGRGPEPDRRLLRSPRGHRRLLRPVHTATRRLVEP